MTKYLTLMLMAGCLLPHIATAEYITDVGFIAECPKTGYDSVLAPECSEYCKNTYGVYVNGTMVTSWKCAELGVESEYTYCCGNNAASDIVRNCKCKDENQVTKTGGTTYAYTITDDGDTWTVTCEDLYCWCKDGTYGTRQLISKSTSGTCTSCPCVDGGKKISYTGAVTDGLCGLSLGGTVITDNSQAPSTTIESCRIGNNPSMPAGYRTTFQDSTGDFEIPNWCYYES